MFNPSRLTLARQRRGQTKKDLASRVGVSARMITKYESGDAEPSSAVIQGLSRALRFPETFFSAETVEGPSVDSVSFRALSSMRASQRSEELAAATLGVVLSQWIAARFELPAPNIPDVRFQDPESAAMAVRAAWGLGERPIKNMVHLLEAHGVRVFSLAGENREVDAFSFLINETPYAFINVLKSAEHGRMDGAHELGHLVMHRHGAPRGRDAEDEAHKFAAAFLMPRDSVLASKPLAYNIPVLLEMKRQWNVSAMALNYRLFKLGMISEWQYRTVCIELSKLGYRRSEPNGIPREDSQVLRKVFHGLREEGVNLADVAKELHITSDDLNLLIFGLVMRHIPGGGNQQSGAPPTPKPNLRRL